MTFAAHPEFCGVKQSMDLDAWQRQGFTKFEDLFVQEQFVTFEYLMSKIQGTNLYQYNQVKSVVGRLIRKQLLRKRFDKM